MFMPNTLIIEVAHFSLNFYSLSLTHYYKIKILPNFIHCVRIGVLLIL